MRHNSDFHPHLEFLLPAVGFHRYCLQPSGSKTPQKEQQKGMGPGLTPAQVMTPVLMDQYWDRQGHFTIFWKDFSCHVLNKPLLSPGVNLAFEYCICCLAFEIHFYSTIIWQVVECVKGLRNNRNCVINEKTVKRQINKRKLTARQVAPRKKQASNTKGAEQRILCNYAHN